MNKKTEDSVWGKAKKVRGKDPELYRQDPYGKTIYKHSRGKATDMGWDIDHIKPRSKGGSDSVRNLQALNSSINRSKGADQRKKSRHSASNK